MNLINWYPGHMAKAIREIKEKSNLVDCFIVLLDSRIPITSYNEEFDKIAPSKPRLFVFSKKDFANINKLNKFLPKYKNELDDYVVVNLKDNLSKQKIFNKLNNLLKNKQEKDLKKGLLKPRLRCFVIGMPNVGKSTLINLLVGNKKVKVANFAGTTRNNQWITCKEDIQFLDTPGILMPKLNNQEDALKLILCNLIKQDIVNNNDFYYKSLDYINIYCPEKLQELGIKYSENESEKYNQIILFAKKNNLITKNNSYDINKALILIRNKILNFKNVIWD